MKKILISGCALAAIATTSAQAQDLQLDVAGHFKGYAIYNNQDELPGQSLRDFNIRKETEVHFTGETTLDSGLTVGVHVEAEADGGSNANDSFDVDESYAYFSGGWGRVNFGEEDGIAYLLQVAAPSADSNIDGVRQYISSLNVLGLSVQADYDHAVAESANKITYITPMTNGFQAGVSYVPSISDSANGLTATASDEDNADYDDGFEIAARYAGEFEGVGIAIGAGYGLYNAETDTAGAATHPTDDRKTFNAGIDLDIGAFGFGVAYLADDQELQSVDVEDDTWVIGADYTVGAYKLGASYYNYDGENGATEVEADRYTGGVTYAYGPGMSFRGSVSYADLDSNTGVEGDSTQVLLGTQINF